MSKDIETIEKYIRMKLKRVYFNGSTDVIARQNGVIPNDTTLGEGQIEVELKDVMQSIQKIIERDVEELRLTLRDKLAIIKFNEAYKWLFDTDKEKVDSWVDDILALTNALYGEKK